MAVADELGVARQPDFDRQPPQDLQAEQSVLGGMLLSKDAIADVVEVLRSADFYRPAHQTLYDVVLDLYGRGEPADPVTVSAELTRTGQLMRIGGTPYLHTLISAVPTAANAGFYAEIVAERATLRRLVEAGTRIVQLGYGAASGQGGDVDEVVDRAQAEIYDVTERRTSEDYVRLEQLLQGTMDEIDAISSRGGASIGVPTGFSELDQITNGLHPGQMVIVAARPAIGKALALDTPLPTPDGWTTMGEVAVGDRLLGADGHPTSVVAATEVMFGRPCYEVEFSDGTVIVADAEHQWKTTRAARPVAGVVLGGRLATVPPDGGVLTTQGLAATLRGHGNGGADHAVAPTRPLDLPERPLPVSPYVLGATLGVLAGGRVPRAYLRASEGQRRALLDGLLDAAGTVRPTGAQRLLLTDAGLAADARELIVSLGYRCSVHEPESVRAGAATTTPSRTDSYVLSPGAGPRSVVDVGRCRACRCGVCRWTTTSTSTWPAGRWCRRTTRRWPWTSPGRARSSTG